MVDFGGGKLLMHYLQTFFFIKKGTFFAFENNEISIKVT